jgi:heme-degrading monooxygenase HmoA
MDEAEKLFRKNVIPLCENKKGFKGAYFLADRKTSIIIPITLWESEEDMLETERSRFFQEQLVKFMKLISGPPHTRIL